MNRTIDAGARLGRALAGALALAAIAACSGADPSQVVQGRPDGGPSACVAAPTTCAAKCGQILDTCGAVTECGACPAGTTCGGAGPNACGTGPCTPSCAGKGCNESDGCSALCTAACGSPDVKDPTTCAEAASTPSYLGCEFWPTVLPNGVWGEFDFTAVVANPGARPATVRVTGPNGVNVSRVIAPGTVSAFYLPWVRSLKGQDGDNCGAMPAGMTASVIEPGGAYRIVSDVPVVATQFNPLEYKGSGGTGNWTTCAARTCTDPSSGTSKKLGCFSFTNDASLLLPTSALTGSYRVIGQVGTGSALSPGAGPSLALTATQDATDVVVDLSGAATVLAGGRIAAASPGGTLSFRLDRAGDVALVVGPTDAPADFSGSRVRASKPVQVITGVPCITQPLGTAACDHVEELVLPTETLGRRYVVTAPTGPNGNRVGHVVRLVGNSDGTRLVYSPLKPTGCPDTLSAGQVVECGRVDFDFDVTGDKEFAVATFMLGGSIVDPPPPLSSSYPSKGDPSQSVTASVEQFRTRYLVLAPGDYDVSYADIVAPQDAEVTLDGSPVTATWSAIGSKGLGVLRVKLPPTAGGAHTVAAKKPVGLQVMGYGAFTSYQYPGGLNLRRIVQPR